MNIGQMALFICYFVRWCYLCLRIHLFITSNREIMKLREKLLYVLLVINTVILLTISFKIGLAVKEIKTEKEVQTLTKVSSNIEPTIVKDTVPYIIEIPEISMETGRYSVTVRLVEADSLTDSDIETVRNYISDTYVIGGDYQIIIEK